MQCEAARTAFGRELSHRLAPGPQNPRSHEGRRRLLSGVVEADQTFMKKTRVTYLFVNFEINRG